MGKISKEKLLWQDVKRADDRKNKTLGASLDCTSPQGAPSWTVSKDYNKGVWLFDITLNIHIKLFYFQNIHDPQMKRVSKSQVNINLPLDMY